MKRLRKRPAVYPAKMSDRNGRYRLSPQHMADANRDAAHLHAHAKREGRKVGSFTHIAWGCGCCVTAHELPPTTLPCPKRATPKGRAITRRKVEAKRKRWPAYR